MAGRSLPLGRLVVLLSVVASWTALSGCRSSSRHETSAAPSPSAAAPACIDGEPEDVCARLCDGGDLESCEMLGSALSVGIRVPADPARGADLLERACDRGRTSSCFGLGVAYFEGRGRPKDETRAWGLMLPACARDPEGCGEFGNLYGSGLGFPRNRDRASRLLTLGCDGGDGASCADLAVLVDDGDGMSGDPVRAMALRQRACALGHTSSCRALGLPAPRQARPPRARTDAAPGD
jgi:TPR repeat protein